MGLYHWAIIGHGDCIYTGFISIHNLIAWKTGFEISGPPLTHFIKFNWNHIHHNICILEQSLTPKISGIQLLFFSTIPPAVWSLHIQTFVQATNYYKDGEKVEKCMILNIITKTLMMYMNKGNG